MFDLIYSIVKYTAPNSIERNTFVDNLSRYYSKNDMYKTKQQLEYKNDSINKLRSYEIKTKNDYNNLKKMIGELDKL